MNILISGGSGLLGHAIVKKLSQNHQLFLVTKKNNQIYQKSDNIHYVYADLATKFDYHLFPNNIDVIIHLAQSSLYKNFPHSAENIFDVNIQSTQRLLEYGLKANIKHFIYTSSGSVYEPYNHLNESDTLNPHSYYANSKLIGERLAKSYESFFDVSIFRLFFLYGSHPEYKHTLINTLIQKIKNQEPIIIEGNESGMVFTPTLTFDIANFLEIYLNSQKNGIYNIANPQDISLLDMVNSLSNAFNLKINLNYNREKKPLKIIPNLKKMNNDFPDFKFHHFKDGLSYILNEHEKAF
jgi:nucleoside-diphosphate-sugar epimerase